MSKRAKRAKERDDATTTVPVPSTTPRKNDYLTKVYQSLQQFGATQPGPMVDASGDYWKTCQELRIAPEVCAANIYAAERHRHQVATTTINEAKEEGDPSAMPSADESKQPEPAAVCETCIPWRKVSRDPIEHAEIASLKKQLDTPLDVYACVGHDLNRETQEVFLMLPVNIHGHLMGPAYEVARGQRDRVAVGIDNVMDAASDARCAGFIVCHNHPGGSPKPSKADMQLTDEIRRATPPGRKFLDHVIIGPDSAYSCVEKRPDGKVGRLYKVKRKK